jgi:hypothetical protein
MHCKVCAPIKYSGLHFCSEDSFAPDLRQSHIKVAVPKGAERDQLDL